MAYVLQKVYQHCSDMWDLRDGRLDDYPFMSSPLSMIILISTYLFVIRNGKKFMEHRKPYDIEKLIIGYNILQIIINSVLFILVTHYIFFSNANYSFRCQLTDFSNSPEGFYEARLSYVYFILKIADFLDTMFFILRKKTSHVSFLHVYHHVMIALGSYVCVLFSTGRVDLPKMPIKTLNQNLIGNCVLSFSNCLRLGFQPKLCKYFVNVWRPGGQGILLGYLNSFVHAVMYTYYLLSIWMPQVKSSSFVKQNITRLQMIQFAILVVHFGHGFVIPGHECGYPKTLSLLGVTQNLFMILLFSDFYWKAYGKASKKLQTD